uniref:Putative secreted protein n=1 Tax=Anopheles darlingi TaxID=43151 RepID=A0A2M4DRM2_ANODA
MGISSFLVSGVLITVSRTKNVENRCHGTLAIYLVRVLSLELEPEGGEKWMSHKGKMRIRDSGSSSY